MRQWARMPLIHAGGFRVFEKDHEREERVITLRNCRGRCRIYQLHRETYGVHGGIPYLGNVL